MASPAAVTKETTVAPVDPAPSTCAPNEKLFRCHALAVNVHVGVGRPAEPAAAKTLYADACNKGYAPSCNNLAVLATIRGDLAAGIDPAALWATACKKLDQAACTNARRAKTHRELAVRLTLADSISFDASRAQELKTAACRAGDVFACDDAASRERVATRIVMSGSNLSPSKNG